MIEVVAVEIIRALTACAGRNERIKVLVVEKDLDGGISLVGVVAATVPSRVFDRKDDRYPRLASCGHC